MEGFGVLRAAALAGCRRSRCGRSSNAIAEPDRTLWRFDDARRDARVRAAVAAREIVGA